MTTLIDTNYVIQCVENLAKAVF